MEIRTLALLALLVFPVERCWGHEFWPWILPEQSTIVVRDPSDLPPVKIPRTPRPPSVSNPQFDFPSRNLSLDEAINTGLANSEVVRVLAGVTAVNSGQTIYDVAISNTEIDQEQSVFDPTTSLNNNWLRNESPFATFDPFNPGRSLIDGSRNDRFGLDFGLSKQTSTGGTVDLGVNSNERRIRPGIFPLNPEGQSSVDLTYTQPLLQGSGFAVNQVPIVVARINTERSFFQFKSAVQSQVRGIIEAYWSLVFARTDLWAREQQASQAEFANERTEQSLRVGSSNSGEVAQTRVALENFRATLLASQARVLDREAALRSILGFPPYDPNRVVPVTPLTSTEREFDWHGILGLAEERRPDLIELKLVLEADQQLLLQSENRAAPRVDAVALYRWNGLEGTMPIGQNLRSRPGQFTDWTLGVNFSVPLGLRRERATMRRLELLISRDRANLEQGLLQTQHALASRLRNLDLSYQQYLRFRAVRAAARTNLDLQMARYLNGITQFINVLQAIVDWGNAVSSEAQSLTQYNVDLANLEVDTGTILESHGISFYEERFGSLGPLGRFHEGRCYPSASRATPTSERYPFGEMPSEDGFDLTNPLEERLPSAPSPAPIPSVNPSRLPTSLPPVPLPPVSPAPAENGP